MKQYNTILKTLVPIAGAFLSLSGLSSAAVTVTYAFGSGSSAASKSGSDAANITAAPFSFIDTVSEDASADTGLSSGGNAFIRAIATGNDLAAALADDDALIFSISTTTGDTFQLDSFTLDFGGSNGTYTTNLVVQSSVGGFGTGNPTLTVTPSSFGVTGTSFVSTSASVDVSGITFNTANPITFQIRFFDSTDGNGIVNRIDNVVLNASIIPEPSVALLGFLGALGLLRRHRA